MTVVDTIIESLESVQICFRQVNLKLNDCVNVLISKVRKWAIGHGTVNEGNSI